MCLINEMKSVVHEIIADERQANAVVYALIKRFGGERLYLPRNDYEARNREIIELYNAGVSIDQLSRRMRLSVKTVQRIISTNYG